VSLPGFGVRNPVPVNLLMAALLLAGGFCAVNLRRQFFPDIEPEAATVSLVYPGATPIEIEETMAIKVEDAVAELDEVDKLRTSISEGGGGITVEFREGISDVSKAVDEVERAIDALRDLPADAERIRVTELEARLPVIMLSIHGDADEAVLKRLIRQIHDELRTLPGMGEVVISGTREYEIRVDLDADSLLMHGISLPQVSDSISAWMAEVPGGSVRSASGNVNVRTIGVANQAEAVRNIVVKADGSGQAIRVADIGTVEESFIDSQLITRFNGDPSATITVFKVGDQDIVKMAEMVRAYADGRSGVPFEGRGMETVMETGRRKAHALGVTAPPLPEAVSIQTHSDLARFVEGRLSLLVENAFYGAILVFGTLLIFLNWRVALWVGVGLATALAGTLVLMYAGGVTLNLLTMFGLIIVMGILVDDAIVVAENIQARHDRHEASLTAAIRGTEQVFWPVVATVLTSIVAFLPLSFVRGQIGDMLGALPVVVACALVMSLIESLLILPSHMGHSLVGTDVRRTKHMTSKGGRVARFEAARDSIILERIIPAYARLLESCIRRRYVALCVAIACLIVSVGMLAGGRLGFTFLPNDDSETLVVNVRMPLGTPIESTSDIVARIEAAARAQVEVQSVSAVVGSRTNLDSGLVDSSATHLAQLFIELYPVESRDRASAEVTTAIRRQAGSLIEAERVSFEEVSGGPSGSDITLEVSSDDAEQVIRAVAAIKAALNRFEGMEDVFDDSSLGQRELQIRLRPGAAALGFTVADVARQVRGSLFGLDAHVFSKDREDIDVRVRLDERTRRSLRAIEELWVISPRGDRVPLVEIAELVDDTGYSTIKRVDRRRTVTVSAETAPGTNPEAVAARFTREDIPTLRNRFPGVTFTFAGRQRQMAFDLTFLSLIGFVALSGIVVNDSLIYMQFYNQRRAEGVELVQALIEAGRQRLRPIFLTTITTVLGLTPLMLEQSFQARFLIPMAIAIAFGLMSATMLILLILPCIVKIVDDIDAVFHLLWNGHMRSAPRDVSVTVVDVVGE
jgi:multidrug efflux pump subunit AcrB